MALKSTIFKADLQIADLDRAYYADHALTLARHPSETDERMMVRLLAFVLHAHERLVFGKGLCVDDEPDLWMRDPSGAVELWIEVGEPQEKWIRRAVAQARRVVILSYAGRAADVWWAQHRDRLMRLERLAILSIPPAAVRQMAGLVRRTMRLQCTVQDGAVWITDGDTTARVEPLCLIG